MAASKTVLITGANRGIGRALAEVSLQQDNITVLACVRDPTNVSSKSLAEISPASGSSVHLVKLNVTSRADYDALPKRFADLKIGSIDTVIANAGIFDTFTTVAETDPEDLKKHFEINTMGPLQLFQATRSLLAKSNAKFVAISAASSSIADMEHISVPATSHGASKAALNWILRKIHFENKDLISFVIDPGLVQTDLTIAGMRKLSMDKQGMPPEESARNILKVIEHASREETSGKFMQHNGAQWRW